MRTPKDRFTLDKELSTGDVIVELSEFTGKRDHEIKEMIPALAWDRARTKMTETNDGHHSWLFIVVTSDQGLSESSAIRFTSSVFDFCMQLPAGISDPETMDKIASLSDIERVGPTKPLGYHSLSALAYCGINDVIEYRRKLEERGIKTLVISEEQGGEEVDGKFTPYQVEILYAYDEKALNELLTENAGILREAGWPIEPIPFIKNLKNKARPGTKLYNLIANAFGDVNNRSI